MRRSIATVSLSGALDDKLAAVSAAGFDGVELFENDLIGCPLSPLELRKQCGELGLELFLYQPLRDIEAVPPELFARNLRRADQKFELMEKLGAKMVLVCSNVSEEAIDDDDLATNQLRKLAELAAARGMRVAYEALAWGRRVHRYEHSWRIVQAADHPALGVCLDSFHILSCGDDPRGIRSIAAEKIFFVQLADAPHLVMDVLQWSRHHRCLPGQGAFNLRDFIEHILAAGYRGPLSLEVFNDVFRQANAGRMAVDAMRSLKVLEDSVASQPNSAPEATELWRLPPPPELRRYAFVELAVDLLSEPVIERTLAALGFSHTGQHRSKPVAMWQHGQIRILLNRHEGAPADGMSADARIYALGLESDGLSAAAARAEMLLADKLPRSRGPREADLVAIAAPDATSIFFCGTEGGGVGSWLDDFIALDGSATAQKILLSVDHVALAQPFEYFDEAVLFYRAVLGLEAQASHELAAPYGLVRSRAVKSPGDGVRVVLNVPLLGGGPEHSPETQHIAFQCGDIFAAARSVRGRGMPVLPITDNYYEDLAARVDLPGNLVEEMCELGVLYDRDEHGTFFHFYTPLTTAHLFFEVVQRVGSYDGYGAANSAIRMAAQRERLVGSRVAGRDDTY